MRRRSGGSSSGEGSRRSRGAVGTGDLFNLGRDLENDRLAESVALTQESHADMMLASEAAAFAATGETRDSALPIAVLNELLKGMLEGSFPPIWVRGEVSNLTQHRSGHWYFTLKDATAQIRCVVWSRDTRRILAPPDEGMEVLARGQLSFYAGRGELQLTILALEGVGDGLWRKAFERTRARLDADGLLAPERKRALPAYPRCIAVITSGDGAALHDIVSVVQRRCPTVEVVLIPAAVQGETAPKSLCAALALAERWGRADLVIVARGGGSREDLWAFNDERVARAVAACPIPTISAVGHEVDVTLCDLVADWRAPTPSVAAEHAVPVLAELVAQVRTLGAALGSAAAARIDEGRERLELAARRASLASTRIVEHGRLRADGIAGRLHALSPLATMGRGYSIAQDAGGTTVLSVAQLSAGDQLSIRFRDGRAHATVQRLEPDRATSEQESR